MLEKAYDPKSTEDRIYKMWEDSGAFVADVNTKKKPFTIGMPPPNATGQLHLGHAVMLALEDIFIRFARMQGREALWVPGTDHAAIATENVVIKQLKNGGMKDPRKELGREKLVAKIAQFVEQSRGTIRSQVRKMGSSCDWTRERYTMDPMLNRCVNEVFKSMYDDGLIYRGHRIVNWDPKLQTTVSDDEIAWVEEASPFYTFQYGPFQIGTVRPETKFGDKYVVMHPDDKRYSKYKHGQTIELEWINGPIRATIIKDAAVDPEFGTGVMTITPWHTQIDFEIAERHGLDKEQVIDSQGKLLPIAGEFEGMHIEKARPLIIEKLEKKGLLVKVDPKYVHNKATNSRGGGTIEPQIKLQWFIDVNRKAVTWKKQKMSLKEIMHEVVHGGSITIIPERFNKTYFHWIDNLRDWCISRQIWWGHRVPVWYCFHCIPNELKGKIGILNDDTAFASGIDTQAAMFASAKPLTKCPKCGKSDLLFRDKDTLDTWFSSALWTWSTLVDPKLHDNYDLTLADILKMSPDFQAFHPTQVMETGYDILFFWVARMILMTTYATGQIPFETVYLHGLVRTRDGRKMSKSDPETMIDPLDMIAKYGADALRLSMIVGQSPGADSRLYEEKIAGYRNFINKLWNASRFVLMQCEAANIDPRSIEKLPDMSSLSLADRALLHGLELLMQDVGDGLSQYRLSEVGERLYSFVWDFFCDWYLELSKGSANHAVLVHVLRRVLKLLHPYCPFVTEELWAHIKPAKAGILLKEAWPEAKRERRDLPAFEEFGIVIEVVTAIRKLRNDQGVEPGKKVSAIVHSRKHADMLQAQREHIMRLAKLESLDIDAKPAKHQDVASAFLTAAEVHMPLAGLVDAGKAKDGLLKEQKNLEGYVRGLKAKLENEQFVAKAPPELVKTEKQKLLDAEGKLRSIADALKRIG